MLKKILLAAALGAGLCSMPVSASAGDYEICMLNNGCFFASGSDTDPGHWVCPGPPIYMDCVE